MYALCFKKIFLDEYVLTSSKPLLFAAIVMCELNKYLFIAVQTCAPKNKDINSYERKDRQPDGEAFENYFSLASCPGQQRKT